MVSPGRNRNSAKRETDDNSDLRSERVNEEEEWEGDDKRKHRSSRSKRIGNVEDTEGIESSGRKRSTGERTESRKRSAGSSRIGSDEDEFQAKKELRSQQMKKKQEESALEKLSNWYEDGEAENKHDGVHKSSKRGHGRADEHERKKTTSKLSDRESSQSRTKSKNERSDVELEVAQERDPKFEPKESSREKGHGSSEKMRSQRRKWDESDAVRNTDDVNYVESSNARTGKSFDRTHENSKEKSLPTLTELSEAKGRDSESNLGKVTKTLDKEERRVDSEKSKSRTRSEAEEDNNGSPLVCEDISDKERLEEHRSQRNPTVVDVVASGEKSITDDDGNTLMRGKTKRDTEGSNRSRSPERSGRRYHESEHYEMEHERNSNFRSKEIEKEGYRDDRFKGRDDSWSNRHRNREGSRDNWKRRQPNITDKDLKDGDTVYDHGRDWELQRRGRDRVDNERPQGRFGGRKDGNRTEAVKTSSNYGNENYDVIEIQTKPFDYVREEPIFIPSRSNEAGQQSDTRLPPNDNDFSYPQDNKAGKIDLSGPGQSVEDSKDISMDNGPGSRDQDSWRGEIGLQSGNGRGENGTKSNTAAKSNSQSSSGGSQLRYVNEEAGSFNRTVPVGNRGHRSGRGRSRPIGRDNQHTSIPVPMVGSPFGPLGMPPPGALQPLTPNMSPGPPIPPGVFIPPFSPPVVWPGARGMDLNLLGVPPGMSPAPPGPSGPRFSPNMGTPPNPAMFYNQPGSGRGGSSNMSGVNFNAMIPAGRGQPQEKNSGGWVPPRSNVPHGKAPSRGEQNDYSQNFVDTGMRPQNYIRELELTSVVEDYPKLRELIQKKDEIVTNSATAPMYYKCDLREQVLSPEFFGTKFDVILVDPPWEEYVHRAPGVTDHMDYWTFEEIMNLKIEAIADTPSFIFLWVGDGLGLEQGRQCLKKWGFRRCEDICWVKTNKTTATPGLRHDSRTLFQRSKEHCLMGIKGTVRRSTDGHIIHANIDTDVIIAEEPPYGSTAKPEGMYRIVEHFCLGRRRLELFGEDHNIRSGWLTVGKDLSSSNFTSEAYIRNFADKDGKIWQGGGGRNPPPEAGHLVLTTPDIESLRPKSPMKNQLQMQQQHSNSITLTTPTSSNKRPGNSPQNYNTPSMNEEASGSNNLGQWPLQMEGFRGQEFGIMGSDDRVFDMYTYNAPFMQGNGDYSDYETRRAMNML